MNTKRIHIVDSESGWGSQDWPPEDAAEALAWFQAKVALIPPEHMASARIEIDGRTEYDSACGHIEIYYDRPYTPEELEALVAEQNRRMANLERAERAKLAELKAKYGG